MHLAELFIALVASHLICDFVLQSDNIATGKNRHLAAHTHGVNWYYWLVAHATTHGVGVGLVTGSVWYGLLEAVLHALIDFGKCEKLFGFHADQLLHVLCKLLIVGLVFLQA